LGILYPSSATQADSLIALSLPANASSFFGYFDRKKQATIMACLSTAATWSRQSRRDGAKLSARVGVSVAQRGDELGRPPLPRHDADRLRRDH
jgi:hypothetical protein